MTIDGVASEEELHFVSNLCDKKVKGSLRHTDDSN